MSVVDSDVILVKLRKPQASAKGVLSSTKGSIGGGAIGAVGGAAGGAAIGAAGGPLGSIVGAGIGAGIGAGFGAYTGASVTGKDGLSYELQAHKENVVDCPVRECFSLMDENVKTKKGRICITIAGELQIFD